MWIKSGNGDANKPLELEVNGDWYIIRKNFRLIDATEDMTEHWEYLEWQMTKEQYDVYHVMTSEFNLQENAILELADLIGGML